MSVIVLVNGYILNTLRLRFVYVIAEHRFQLDTSYWSSQPMSLRCAAVRLRFYTLTGSTLQQSCRKNSTRHHRTLSVPVCCWLCCPGFPIPVGCFDSSRLFAARLQTAFVPIVRESTLLKAKVPVCFFECRATVLSNASGRQLLKAWKTPPFPEIGKINAVL